MEIALLTFWLGNKLTWKFYQGYFTDKGDTLENA